MYSSKEISVLTEQFWTALGVYMSPIPAADGEKINWINYKTGIKNLSFRLEADQEKAFVGICLTHPDPQLQMELFNKLRLFKKDLQIHLQEEWEWQPFVKDEYEKTISLIYRILPGHSILNRSDWPALISFFKPRLIGLDAFWFDNKDVLEYS